MRFHNIQTERDKESRPIRHRRRKGSLVGGTMASAEHERITGVWGKAPGQGVKGAKPPEAESISVIGCPTESANLAPVRENSMFCYGPPVSELGGSAAYACLSL